MRIFVTGAAGFIGGRLSRRLLDRGDQVVGLDNLNDYYPVEHKRRNLADLLADPKFTFIEGDLRDADGLRRWFDEHRPDAVAHLAAMAAVRYSVQHPLIYGHVNVQGSMNLLDAARHLGPIPCILASTGSAYGGDTPVPFEESASAAHPLAPYPASKRSMEMFAHCYHHLWKLPVTILRFFNVYGPYGRPDMMPWEWSRAIHHGRPITLYNAGHLHRDWTYIDDILSGFVRALDKAMPFELINLGCGRPVENLQFVRIIEQLLGKSAQITNIPSPASEPLITYADISKARRLLDYEPKTNVEQGLEKFIRWMTDNRLL